MPSIATEGIVLKRKNFGEADRVLTVLSKQLGKISIIARGVRRITSRRAGNIEVLNRAKLHLFKAHSYNLQEAEALDTYPNIKKNLTRSTNAFHVIELTDRIVAENQFNPHVYPLLASVLGLLEENPRQVFIRAFEVKLLSVSGFWSVNALAEVPQDLRSILKSLEYSSWNEISKMQVGEQEAVSLENLLRGFIEKILEAKLRSVQVMRKIKSGG